MKKIPTIFTRGDDGRIADEIHPDCLWVFKGEGVPTRKWDGTACLWDGGRLWKRYTRKPGKAEPTSFVASSKVNPETGKQEGWVPVGDGPEDKWHRAALIGFDGTEGQTYELCGEKVQGNPERLVGHSLLEHGCEVLSDLPSCFAALDALQDDYFRNHDIEGIVWHHPDGRMAKIKGTDFGIARPTPEEKF